MESSKIEKILVYLVTIVIIGLVSYIFLRVEKSVDQNTSAVGMLSERVAKLEASIGLISKIDSGSGRVHTPELQITELLNVEGIKFKVRMASELDKDGSPVELRKRFSLRKDKRMYVHLEWLDQAGEHRVVVRWIMPDRRIYTENIYDTNFVIRDARAERAQNSSIIISMQPLHERPL